MTYRPLDEHDRVLDLENKLNRFRNSNITPRNNGVAVNQTAFGQGSKTSSMPNLNGAWAITPKSHNVGHFDTAGNFVNNTPDGGGRYHIQLFSSSVLVTGTPANPIPLSFIDGTRNNGQVVLIKPAVGKTITLKAATTTDTSTGNLKLDSDITIDENHMAYLQFFNDIGTGGGKYLLIATSSTGGGGVIIPWSSVTPIDVDKDMNNHSLTNLNTIGFHSSTANLINFTTSGDGAQLNFIVNGFGAGDITTTTGGGNNTIFEINGGVLGTNNPSIKIVNNKASGGTGFIGSIFFDGNNSSSSRLTYVRQRANVLTNTAGAEDGVFYLGLVKGGTMGDNLIIDANANLATFQNGTTGSFGLRVNPSSGSGWSLIKAAGTPAIYTSNDGHQFNNVIFPGSSSVNIGGASTPFGLIVGKTYGWFAKSGVPSVFDIPSGTWSVYKNTNNNTYFIYLNDSNSIFRVQLT